MNIFLSIYTGLAILLAYYFGQKKMKNEKNEKTALAFIFASAIFLPIAIYIGLLK